MANILSKEKQTVIVSALAECPVNSAETAVKAAIIAKAKA